MTASHPGDCRCAGDLPARYYAVYLRHLKHGHDAAFAHAKDEWRRELLRKAVTKPADGLFGEVKKS